MPNVNKCVNVAEISMADDGDIRVASQIISTIKNNNRVVLFREKSENEIFSILNNIKNSLKEYFNTLYNSTCFQLIKSSPNNKKDADLISRYNNLKYNVELKFGSQTARNLGGKLEENLFGYSIFKNILNKEKREVWRNNILNGMPLSEHMKVLHNELNIGIDEFNSKYANTILSEVGKNYLETKILNNSGSMDNELNNYLKFMCKENGCYLMENIETNGGEWTILPIKKLTKDEDRVRIEIKNKSTGAEIVLVLNWKNNYHMKENGMIIESKYGLKTFSWNVWATQ